MGTHRIIDGCKTLFSANTNAQSIRIYMEMKVKRPIAVMRKIDLFLEKEKQKGAIIKRSMIGNKGVASLKLICARRSYFSLEDEKYFF